MNNYFLITRRCLQSLRETIASSRTVTRLIFNVDIPFGRDSYDNKLYWDLTTPVLKKSIFKYARNSQRILEIGTGGFGILSISLAKHVNAEITAVDINPVLVTSARGVAEFNNVDITIKESDMFRDVRGAFDIVFWNLPYVPTGYGAKFYNVKESDIKKAGAAGWDGGTEGTDILRSFLRAAPRMITENGLIIAGLNTFYIPVPRVKSIIDENALELKSVCSSFCNPSKAFIMCRKNPA